MKDSAEEWRQLHALYTEMSDTQLLELRAGFSELTDMAQGELRDELKRRELWDMPLPEAESAEVGHGEGEPAYDAFGDLMLGGVTVGEYDTVNEANLATYVLDLEGIQAVMGGSNGSFDVRLPFVRVAPEDADRAIGILARPISAQTRAEYEELRNLPEFEVPNCPNCSCAEVLLQEVEPTNQWFCGECGHRWQDATPQEDNAS